MAYFGETSNNRLNTVDPKLKRLFEKVVVQVDCTVLEGRRTMERQHELYEDGKTKTLNSKHLTGDAVDVVPYPVDWEDIQRQKDFALLVLDTAMKMGIKVRWGGMFKGFYDSPHWELI